jgi:hypothetical protein
MMNDHIRVLRTEAAALKELSAEYEGLAPTVERTTAIIIFSGLAGAKLTAADALAQDEADRRPPLEGVDQPITFNPRGIS